MIRCSKKGTVVPFNQLEHSLSTKPSKLFIYEKSVEKYGLLKAAVIADLYFWFVNEKKPFRRYQDHALWFHVKSSCIGNAHNSLTDDHELFTRHRPRSKEHGGLLSYVYSYGSNEFCKELLLMYADLFDHCERKSDLGNYIETCVMHLDQKPKILTLLTSTIDEFEDLTTAYIYSRLCWVNHSDIESNSFSFLSMVRLSNWLGLNKTTVRRRMDKLEKEGYLNYQLGHRVNITLNINTGAYNDYEEWIFGVLEQRSEAIIDTW